LLGIAHKQSAEHESADDAEGGCVCADAERAAKRRPGFVMANAAARETIVGSSNRREGAGSR
jgi:hypothetical protein